MERSPPVLLTRETLHLWLNITLNHEWVDDRKLFGYVLYDMYVCMILYDVYCCIPAQLFIYLCILLEG